MQFKVDENLPREACKILRNAGHDAVSVLDQQLGGYPDADIAAVCKSESRILVTLDTDFANILAYPPKDFRKTFLALLLSELKISQSLLY